MTTKCPKCRFKFDVAQPADGSVVNCVCPRCGHQHELELQQAMPEPSLPEALQVETPTMASNPAQPVQQQPVQPQPVQPQVIYVKSGSNNTAWIVLGVIAVIAIIAALLLTQTNIFGDNDPATITATTTDDNATASDVIDSSTIDEDTPPSIDELRQMIIANPRSHDVIEQWSNILSAHQLTEDDIWGIDSSTLRFLRNAIFARHNYRFKSQDLMDFYTEYDWYYPEKANVIAELNSTETYNIEFFKRHE